MLATLLNILLPLQATAQEALPNEAVYVGLRGETQVSAPRLEGEVDIDGMLDEAVWAQAAVLTGFSQYEPVDGRAAADTTQVLVWYSPTGIYFGVKAFSALGPVNATLADRDRIEGDDYVQLLLDTFDDQRQALLFGVNPFGIQQDGNWTEGERGNVGRGGDDGGINLTPDYVFESRGRLTDYGYDVELHIPFESISYQAAEVQDWGVNVVRKVQHSGYTDTWTPARRGAASFLAQSGRLVAMRDLARGRVMDFTPAVTAALNGAPAAGSGGGDGWGYGRRTETGGNFRWGVSANLTIDATVNPDFSQVEADVGQLSSNERFALFFPEKRPFFLEGIDRFDTPNRLIYTRRLQDPVAGVKLTGKVAGTSIGLLSGVDGSVANSLGRSASPYFNAVRLVRDVGGQSTLGMAYTDRVVGDDFNRVAAADARLVLADLYTLALQGGASFTRTEGVTRAAPIWEANFERTGRRLVLGYQVSGIHPDFEAQAGFVNRPGVVYGRTRHRVNFYGAQGAFLERWTPGFMTLRWWDYLGVLDEEPIEAKTFVSSAFQLRGGWEFRVMHGWESYAFDPDWYADYGVVRDTEAGPDTVFWEPPERIRGVRGWIPTLSTPEFSSFAATLSVAVWRDVGFAEARGVWLYRPIVNVDWRPTDQLRVNFRYSELTLDRRSDDSNMSSQKLPRLSLEYQISRFLFVRLVGQYDSHFRDALRAGDTDEPIVLFDSGTGDWRRSVPVQDNQFTGDVLLSYRPTPGTVLFLGYGSTLHEPDAFRFREMERDEDRFFMKLSYLFRR